MDRYDRQRRVRRWRQQALTDARVMVFGAGAIGNEVLKNMALMGVGHLLIVDFDRIERSNLSRSVLFKEADVGQLKSEAAAAALRRLNPEIDVRSLNGDLFYDVGLGFYRHADLVISGLDNIAARSHVGVCCSLAGVPFLDGGMWALGGEVRWFMSGEQACFECTLTDEDRRHASERRACAGFRMDGAVEPPMPSTIGTTAVIGGLMTQEAVRYLSGWERPESEALVYNGLGRKMHRSELVRNPDCPYHAPYEDVVELDASATETTARELIHAAGLSVDGQTVLELGRDFLLGLECGGCGFHEPVNLLVGRVHEGRAVCPRCGRERKPEIVSRLKEDGPLWDRKLNALGVPRGEVLSIRTDENLFLYEMTKDIRESWPFD